MTPQLRFPEFIDEWQTKKLGDLLSSIQSGLSPSAVNLNPKKGTPFLKVEDLNNSKKYQKHSRNYAVDIGKIQPVRAGSIIFPKRGAAIMTNKVRINKINVLLDTNLMALSVKDFADSNFLYFKILNDGLYKIADTSTIPQINNKHIIPYKIKIPSKSEQEKIAEFLTAVDERVGLQDKKVELLQKYKKSVMQKIFSQKIRFKDENGKDYPEWQKKNFGELLDYEQPTKYIVESTDYDNQNDTPVLTAGKTFVLGYTDETAGIFDNLPVIIFDDFTTASHFVDFKFKVKSSAMKVLKAKKGINPRLAYELLKQVNFTAENHQRHWISLFQQLITKVPSRHEQQKIADFLTALDDKINAEITKLTEAKKFKKALLQRMFV